MQNHKGKGLNCDGLKSLLGIQLFEFAPTKLYRIHYSSESLDSSTFIR